MKTLVYIRADGNNHIGLGHLVRCMALAHMLKDDFAPIFVCKEAPETIREEMLLASFIFKKIENEEAFFSMLTGNEIVVLDHYGLETNYQRRIKDFGCKLVCIDDLHDKEFYADLIINHTPGIEPFNYLAQSYTQFALGTDYLLLRPAFLEAATARNFRVPRKEKILICFGGADSRNLTQLALDIVLTFEELKEIVVITGAAYQSVDRLNTIIQSSDRIKYYNSVSADKMATLMLSCNVAIVPASGVLFEALACGCIAISGTYADNQRNLFEEYKKYSFFIDAGDFSAERIQHAIFKYLTSSDACQNAKINGKDISTRIRKLFSQL